MNLETQKNSALGLICEFTNCDSEQQKNLSEYIEFLLEQNQKFNFIGKSTIEEIWHRHILDCAQLLPIISQKLSAKKLNLKNLKIADFGSGAGFPGMILSILGIPEIYLIEKSFRKSDFLKQARNFSKNRIIVHQSKIEELPEKNLKFDIITSRALAPLSKLLTFCENLLTSQGFAIFLKGRNLENELLESKKFFDYQFQLFPSITAKDSQIILVEKILSKTL